jgi:hypothetical protein
VPNCDVQAKGTLDWDRMPLEIMCDLLNPFSNQEKETPTRQRNGKVIEEPRFQNIL